MSGFLLNTNLVSEPIRVKPERRVLEWIEAADEGLLYLSVLTLGELRKGVAGLAQGKRRTRLDTWQVDCKPDSRAGCCPSTSPLRIAGVCLPRKPRPKECFCP